VEQVQDGFIGPKANRGVDRPDRRVEQQQRGSGDEI
jgi:hypothetical protein